MIGRLLRASILILLLAGICGCEMLAAAWSGDIRMSDMPAVVSAESKSRNGSGAGLHILSDKMERMDSWIKRQLW